MEESDQGEGGFEIKVDEGEGEEDGAGAKTDATGNYFGQKTKDEKGQHKLRISSRWAASTED